MLLLRGNKKRGVSRLADPHPSEAVGSMTSKAAALPAFPEVASSSPTTATTSSKGARGTVFARARLVDGQITPLDVLPMQGFGSGLGRFGCGHSDEGKPTRFAGGPVEHEVDLAYGAMLRKQIFQIVFGNGVGQIAYEQLGVHSTDIALDPLRFRNRPDRRASIYF